MTKKKKPKRGISGKGTSASPSSSASSHSSGASNQASDKTYTRSPPIKLDLVASGSVDLPISDLPLEPRATVQIESVSVDTPAAAVNSALPITATFHNDGAQDTPVSPSAKATTVANPDKELQADNPELQPATKDTPLVSKETSPVTNKPVAEETPAPANKPVDEWKKGTPFTLPSGEKCIKIPNSLIEKNKKSWESFVIGQFYSDPPAQSLIHNIVNGIWSKQYRDITVSKLEGFAFLFRIPHAGMRNHVINQRLWQIEGQTMFVANWEPGNLPEKPALTSAPIWLELRNVPLQFFNEDGLERIAGLVGHPKYLHPTTANKSNLEVAKVLTIIDPREPLPEAVNVQFDSGHICRVTVSSPWMPPVCSHCKEIGHSIKRCPSAPITCKNCKSTVHTSEACTRVKVPSSKKAKRPRQPANPRGHALLATQEDSSPPAAATRELNLQADRGKGIASSTDRGKGIANSRPPKSGANHALNASNAESSKANGSHSVSEAESDSSDVPSSDPDAEEG
ncbi:hypothetical protein BRARA_H02553, partial [Brassica rapa]